MKKKTKLEAYIQGHQAQSLGVSTKNNRNPDEPFGIKTPPRAGAPETAAGFQGVHGVPRSAFANKRNVPSIAQGGATNHPVAGQDMVDEMDFDTSDTPQEPTPQTNKKRPPPIPVRTSASASAQRKPLPGVRTEGPTDGQPPARRRDPSQTMQMTPQPAAAQSAAVSPSGKWDVTLPDGRVLRIPASSSDVAQKTAGEWMRQQPPPAGARDNMQRPAEIDFKRLQVAPAPNESTAGGSMGAGPQLPLSAEGMAIFRTLVNMKLQEIVRKKEGGGGYNLYPPNKGKKKKNQKAVGEFPTRLAAKNAELARFPPKDPEQLKRARARLDKLKKDPRKQQDAARKELSAKKPRRSGKSAGERKAKKEAIVGSLVNALHERLFKEDDVPGSQWDERIAALHPDALAQDKKLHKYLKSIEMATSGALGDGHRALMKVMKGMAKVHQAGDVMRDPDRGKSYMPIMFDVDGDEIGPIHLYVDGGHVKIEVSPEAREAIAGMDPTMARDLRGGLMSFQEDHLPKIDRAKRAWDERDSYLDKLHQRLEKTVGGLSGVEHHLARQLMNKRKR